MRGRWCWNDAFAAKFRLRGRQMILFSTWEFAVLFNNNKKLSNAFYGLQGRVLVFGSPIGLRLSWGSISTTFFCLSNIRTCFIPLTTILKQFKVVSMISRLLFMEWKFDHVTPLSLPKGGFEKKAKRSGPYSQRKCIFDSYWALCVISEEMQTNPSRKVKIAIRMCGIVTHFTQNKMLLLHWLNNPDLHTSAVYTWTLK